MITKPGKNELVCSYKVSKRVDLDISTVSASFKLSMNEDQTVKKIDIVYGGMADRPKRASIIEQFLTKKSWSKQSIDEAIEIIDTEFQPISDARASAEGRVLMAKNLLLKFWSETYADISHKK
jgi:xanthine dehydrogenase small subunit